MDKKNEKDIISKIKLDKENNSLNIYTKDGCIREFKDDGQCCCEYRYMTSNDDNLDYFIGAQYIGYDVSGFKAEEVEFCDIHETQFLNIHTSKGVFTIVTHNEHNGWYGGFNVNVQLKKDNSNEGIA